jgi:hypothetical protein
VIESMTRRILGTGLVLLAGCAGSGPEPPAQHEGAFVAQACPDGTVLHRSEKYWEEFADWPAQWCALPDGTKHGPWTEWHADGHLRRKGFYVNGVPEGHWIVWKKAGWWKLWGDPYERIELEYSGGTLRRADRAS